MTFNCDLDLESARGVVGSAYHLTEANILRKFYENLLKGSGDTEWT